MIKYLRDLCAVALLISALTIQTAISAPASVQVRSEGDITWVEATLAEAASGGVKIKILAPGRSGRRLWQTCSFKASDAGAYRCGIDTSAGSAATTRSGQWRAVFVVGETRVVTHPFRIADGLEAP